MTLLVTGFEPFGGERVNPSALILPALPRQIGGHRIETAVLPCVFARALPALGAVIDQTGPDLVLALGQAGGRAALTPERVAINLDDARIPDNEGAQPIDRPVIAGGPAAYFTTLPIKAAVRDLRAAGLPAAVSLTAGSFLCNHIFYGLMHLAATRGNRFRGGFMHVPYLPEQKGAVTAPSMTLADMVRGVTLVLEAALTNPTDIATVEGRLD